MLRVATLVVICGAFTASAFAFGTKPGTHNLGSEHEKITRAATKDLEPRTLEQLSGSGEYPGAVGAPDQSNRNMLVNAASHCQAGTVASAKPDAEIDSTQAALIACRAYIVSHLDDAVAWAGQLSEPTAENTSIACDFNGTGSSVKCNVLEHLGLAFHASQDFYAQTNWVDRPSKAEISPENPPGLGKSGRADWLDPRKSIPFPEGLISGCPGDIVVLGVTFGCENGALIPIPGKMFVLSENLNKDTGPIGIGMGGVGTTKRGKINGNFGRAVSAAIEDTADKWAYFKEQLQKKFGNKRRAAILCALQRDKFDLATCSKEIAQQQSCAKRETLLTSGDFGDDDETPQIEFSTDDIEIAKTLYEGLSQFCVIEETDITRSEVTHGGVADNGRINAKASAIRALATWHSCPAALNRNLSTTSQRNKEAYQALINKPGSNGKLEMTLLTRLYADCILGAHLQRSSK